MLENAKKIAIAMGLFLVGLAIAVASAMSRRAAKAQEKISASKEQDAALTERRKMNAGQLAVLTEEMAKIRQENPQHTPEQVQAELRRRGHIL